VHAGHQNFEACCACCEGRARVSAPAWASLMLSSSSSSSADALAAWKTEVLDRTRRDASFGHLWAPSDAKAAAGRPNEHKAKQEQLPPKPSTLKHDDAHAQKPPSGMGLSAGKGQAALDPLQNVSRSQLWLASLQSYTSDTVSTAAQRQPYRCQSLAWPARQRSPAQRASWPQPPLAAAAGPVQR
jgi:hypothetical protein